MRQLLPVNAFLRLRPATRPLATAPHPQFARPKSYPVGRILGGMAAVVFTFSAVKFAMLKQTVATSEAQHQDELNAALRGDVARRSLNWDKIMRGVAEEETRIAALEATAERSGASPPTTAVATR